MSNPLLIQINETKTVKTLRRALNWKPFKVAKGQCECHTEVKIQGHNKKVESTQLPADSWEELRFNRPCIASFTTVP
jgi:hypothetical protein